MNRPHRVLAALAGAAALTAAGVAPAAGARWIHQDPAGDVAAITYTYGEDSVEVSDPVPAPDNRNTDVTRLVVRHGLHRLVLTLHVRDITATTGNISYDIRTPTRSYWAEQRLGTNRSEPAFTLDRRNGDRVRCSGLRRNVDRAAERATLSIPRSCLGRPRWFRVGAGVAGPAEVTADSITQWADDSQRDHVEQDLRLSPRVARG